MSEPADITQTGDFRFRVTMEPPPIDILNDDGSVYLKLEANGRVSGTLADEHPEATEALRKLGIRIQTLIWAESFDRATTRFLDTYSTTDRKDGTPW